MRRCLAALAVLLSFSGCTTTGLVVGPDFGPSSQAAKSLGAKLVRAEFEIGSSCSSMEPELAAYDAVGARVLVLAGFEGRIPSVGEAQSLAQWAVCFGPGSTWAKTHQPVTSIEFGNETSYGYQYPGCVGTGACYSQRAQDYAARFMAARQAISSAGVRLLAQADHGGNGTNVWVHGLKLGGLTSAAVGGWTVHPYGPSPTAKIGALVSQTAAEGFSDTIPVFVTEYGITSRECPTGVGAQVTGNSDGWPTNLNYQQAATDLRSALSSIRQSLGDRLGDVLVYGAKDGLAACGDSNREGHFGALHSDLSDKDGYSAAVRDELTR
jgi:hypothetical protein